MTFVATLGTLWLALLYAFTGTIKLLRPGLADALDTQAIIPPRLRPALATSLPWLELAIASLLATPMTARVGAVGSLVFALAVLQIAAVARARGTRAPCGCGGDARQSLGRQTIARAVVMIAASLTVVVYPSQGSLAVPLLAVLAAVVLHYVAKARQSVGALSLSRIER